MKTSVIEVHDMLSVLSVDEVEKRTGDVPGVESVTVNFAAGNATVRYDETRLKITDLKSAVRQRGYESTTPDASSADPVGKDHEGHTAPDAPPATAAPAAAKTAPATPVAAGAEQQNKVKPPAAPSTPVAAAPKPSPPVGAASDEQPDKASAEKS